MKKQIIRENTTTRIVYEKSGKSQDDSLQALLTQLRCLKKRAGLIDEVARFLLIAAEAPDYVAPSADVDQVIHEMLSNNEMLDKVQRILNGKIIHVPGICGEELINCYSRTLQLYRAKFGIPPAHVWSRINDQTEIGTSPAVCGVQVKANPGTLPAAACSVQAKADLGTLPAVCGIQVRISPGTLPAVCGVQCN